MNNLLWLILWIGLQAPAPLTWKTLGEVNYKKIWDAKEQTYVLNPQFSPKILALKGKEVQISGYMIPVDLDANYYVLSANAFAACFFCGQAGPETVASLKFAKPTRRFQTDERINIKGFLRLNYNDVNELTYIIEKASLAH